MIDVIGRRNRGWQPRKPAPSQPETRNSTGKGKDADYPEGMLLRRCKAGCGAWVPYGPSFHFEACPNQ